MKYSLFLLLAVMVSAAYGQAVEWKTLAQSDYSIQYPATWQANASGQMGTKFILFAPKDGPDDKFNENVNLLSGPLTDKKMTLDEYVKVNESQIETGIEKVKMLKSEKLKNSRFEYYRVIYTGDHQDMHLEFEQYYIIVNQVAYVLTFTTEAARYSKYKDTGEKILNSFTIKK